MVHVKINFQNWYLLKPSWKLRGEIHSGGVLFSQRTGFETGGEISNHKNASRNLIHIPLTICKRILKRPWKDLQKQNMWCKSGPKCQIKESNPFTLIHME